MPFLCCFSIGRPLQIAQREDSLVKAWKTVSEIDALLGSDFRPSMPTCTEEEQEQPSVDDTYVRVRAWQPVGSAAGLPASTDAPLAEHCTRNRVDPAAGAANWRLWHALRLSPGARDQVMCYNGLCNTHRHLAQHAVHYARAKVRASPPHSASNRRAAAALSMQARLYHHPMQCME